jgi:hypothetical protein
MSPIEFTAKLALAVQNFQQSRFHDELSACACAQRQDLPRVGLVPHRRINAAIINIANGASLSSEATEAWIASVPWYERIFCFFR